MTDAEALRRLGGHNESAADDLARVYQTWREIGVEPRTAHAEAERWMLAEFERRVPSELIEPLAVLPL